MYILQNHISPPLSLSISLSVSLVLSFSLSLSLSLSLFLSLLLSHSVLLSLSHGLVSLSITVLPPPLSLSLNIWWLLTEDRQWVPVTEGISVSDVLPFDWSYFTYQGSLTTPPCYETVTWINMRCPIKVSRRVLNLVYVARDFISLYSEV